MLVAIIVWAFAFPFIRIGLDELSFVNLTIMRFFIVCLIFLILMIIQSKKFSKLQKSFGGRTPGYPAEDPGSGWGGLQPGRPI
jgi:drug/metabolite transporter (DMT)-like permease